MLDIKRMQYLEAIFLTKNFTKASDILFVSQPTISTAVNSLERELGIKLMHRNSKGVVFTPEGERFMQHVLHILKEVREAEAEMKDLADNQEATLRLGISSLVSSHIISTLFADFRHEHPNLSIELDTGPMSGQIEKVLGEQLDLAYNAIPALFDPEELAVLPIHKAEVCLFMRANHPLAKLDAIPLSALHQLEVVMTDTKSKIYKLMSHALQENGIHPKIIAQHDQMLCLLNIVEEGNYVGFVSMINNQHPYGFEGMEVRPLDVPITFELGFLTKKGRYLPQIAREFVQYVQNTTSI